MDRQLRIQQEREELKQLTSYNPFGKGGSGAPLRDHQGNVITVRKAGGVSFADQQKGFEEAKNNQIKSYQDELREQIRERNEKQQTQHLMKK